MKTGISMGSGIVNTNKVKPIKCNCNKCIHSTNKQCDIYGYNPNKKMCKRYYRVNIGNKKKSINKVSKAERMKSFKEGLIDKTIL